ncbi:MAG: hypothetical protein ACPHCI_02740 [Solirubrobacterales bacterium]
MTVLSLAGVSAASAATVFSSPGEGSFVNLAPNIQWTSEGAFNPPILCKLAHTSETTVGPLACDSAPFDAVPDATDPSNVAWTMSTDGLVDTDGTYQFTVDTDFTAGGSDSKTLTFIYDATAPAVTIGPTPALTNDNTPTFSFGVVDANLDTVECALDAPGISADLITTYGPCTTPTSFTPGTGVVQPIQCRYNVEAFVPCDAAFTSRTLLDGVYTLGVMAIDNAGNTAVSSTPFSVATSLDDIDEPTTPSRVRAKKLSGKVKGSKYRLKLRGSFAVPRGFDPKVACKGRVRFSIKGRLKGKKAKTFTKKPKLKASRRTCVYSATFSIPKGYKRKRLTTRTVFRGNTLFGGFSKTATIRRA